MKGDKKGQSSWFFSSFSRLNSRKKGQSSWFFSSFSRFNSRKRGISAIVATVLIILITVAAVTIIWTAIIPMITKGANFDDPSIQVKIDTQGGYTFYDAANKQLRVQVSRGADDANIAGIRVIVDIDGNSEVYPLSTPSGGYYAAPNPNEKKTIVISDINKKPTSVKVVVLMNKGNGIEESSSSSSVDNVLAGNPKTAGTVTEDNHGDLGSGCTETIGSECWGDSSKTLGGDGDECSKSVEVCGQPMDCNCDIASGFNCGTNGKCQSSTIT